MTSPLYPGGYPGSYPTDGSFTMAILDLQRVDVAGLVTEYDPANAGGDQVVAGAGCFVAVRNGDATATTVTLVTPGTVEGLAIADRPYTVAAGAERWIPVGDLYRDRATGLASITYSKVTSLTIGAVRAPVRG